MSETLDDEPAQSGMRGNNESSRHAFEDALAFTGSAGRFALEVDDRWEAQPGTVFGGFLLAVVVRATGLVSTASRPLSISCEFLRPAKVGLPIEAVVVSRGRGRTNELLAVTLGQAGKSIAEAHVRAVDGDSGPVFEPARHPTWVDPLSFPLTMDAERAAGHEPARFFSQIEARDSRVAINDCDAAAWWRLGPGIVYTDPWLEAARLAMSMDAAGGAVVHRLVAQGHERDALPWVFSNLDGLVQFHEPAGTDWIYIENNVLTASGGYVSAQTQSWSTEGELLATGITQLRFFDRSALRA